MDILPTYVLAPDQIDFPTDSILTLTAEPNILQNHYCLPAQLAQEVVLPFFTY